tara:strand:+ start:521 stop:2422 length:1902 start_codon:yes stop_codon:yes gene_type:complete
MCGFVGVFGSLEQISLDHALKAINHRGPDDTSIKKGLDWIVGFKRLSIIDLGKEAMQPFENECCLVYLNGEIYNYIELINEFRNEFTPQTSSDVEIIPFLYKRYGLNFLEKLNGMFSMVLIDKQTNKKYLIRDRFGQKPLYYTKTNKSIIFSSEIKAIKGLTDLKPDKGSVYINLACWMLPPPLTLFKNVFSLMPGELLSIEEDLVINSSQWYKLDEKVQKDKFSEEKFISIFSNSVNIRTRSDVPISIYLSGGLDSMMICNFMRNSSQVFSPLTADVSDKAQWDNGDEANTDVENPQRYCKENNLINFSAQLNYDYWNKNIIRTVKNYEEIFIDSGNLVFYRLAALAKEKNIKVVLAGNGGDELFGGYPWQSKVLNLNPLFRSNINLSRNIQEIIENSLIKLGNSYLTNKVIRALQLYLFPGYYHSTSLSSSFVPDIIRESNIGNSKLRSIAENNFHSNHNNDIDWGNRVNISNFFSVIPSQNYKADMGSMAYSIENRAPFLDYRVVEYMLSISHNDKVKAGPKSLLRKVSKKYLPSYVSNAKKSGPTMPVNNWFASNNNDMYQNFLLSNKSLIIDFMGEEFANSWLKEDGYRRNSDNGLAVFSIISLILWLKLNYENQEIEDDCPFSELLG